MNAPKVVPLKQETHVEKIQKLLLRKLDELEAQQVKCELKLELARQGDVADRASDESDVQKKLDLMDRRQRVINRIHNMLWKIQLGTWFGACEDCGNDIPLKRIELSPGTEYCVTCQEKQEKGR